MNKFKLVQIDAVKYDDCWEWNNSYTLESDIYISDSELTTRKILKMLRDWNYLTEESKGKLTVDIDDYAITIQLRGTYEPIFALISEDY